jgi:hypothetical protein
VAGVAAEAVLDHLDPAIADRRAAEKVDGQPPKMGQAPGAARSTARQIGAEGGRRADGRDSTGRA